MPLYLVLLYALLLCNVLARWFTNELNVLPRIFNVIDIPIVGILFLISRTKGVPGGLDSLTRRISKRLRLFCVILVLGAVLNSDYLYLPAALSQAVMLVEPLLLFLALSNIPFSELQIASFSQLLWKLIVLELVVGVVQLAGRIGTGGDSELVHGTFSGSSEHYATFLMVGIFYLIGLSVVKRTKRNPYLVLAGACLILNVSMDNKASWLGSAVSLAFVLWHLDIFKTRQVRIIGFLSVIAASALLIGYLAVKTSSTLVKYEKLWTALKDGNITQLGKVKSYFDVFRSWLAHPHTVLVGAGPSNMYSRACRQFYLGPASRAQLYVNPSLAEPELEVSNPDNAKASDSMAGTLRRTVAEPYYLKYYTSRNQILAIGSKQVDGPFSPYAGLLGETGLVGTWLYVSMYIMVLRRLLTQFRVCITHIHAFLLSICSIGLMVYILVNSLYGPFLETTRLTTMLWSMTALGIKSGGCTGDRVSVAV